MKRMKVRALSFALALGLVLGGVTSCSTVPISGRKQLVLVPDQQALQLGLSAFEQMKKETPISTDPEANALVQKVGQRIAAVAELPGAEWEFVVFDDEQANAFALPGGKVGVYKGILDITQDEAGLATVIGHEVAHVVAKHGQERMSEAIALQAGGQVVDAAVASYDPRLQSAATIVYGLGAQFGRMLPHSRKQETEADQLGLVYMARAGYDPRESLEFWTRFGAHTGANQVPWFFSTHPVTETRIEDLKEFLPRAMREFRESRISAR